MRAIELKLGNYITSNGILCRVISIDRNGVIAESVKFRGERFTANIEPIPLTEKWLVKFGFEKTDEYDAKHEVLKLRGFADYSLKHKLLEIVGQYPWYNIKIEHVHELQNLYFALTGNELKLKEEL